MTMAIETFLSICVGCALSAACGFRVFVPLLALSIGAMTGIIPLAPDFQWVGTYPAIVCFSVATVCEILAYYVPVFDHFLDTIASPAAIIAGTVTTAAVLAHVDPWLQWTLAVIAGGGLAATTQVATVSLRAVSALATAWLGNPVVATIEAIAAVGLSILALLFPVIAALVAFAVVFLVVELFKKIKRSRPA